MLELHLRSGTVVAFDGRIVEVFAEGGPGRRFHIDHLGETRTVEASDGGYSLTLGQSAVTLAFAREEAPACARLIASLTEARATLTRGDTG